MNRHRIESVRRLIGNRKVVASISGGRDSAAMSLYLAELGVEHTRIFADTGWEHRLTYEYLRGDLTRALGPIVEVRGDMLFKDLVRHKRIFPDRTKRFCTTELKVIPILRFIDALDEDVVNTIGIRRAESEKRSTVTEWDDSSVLGCEVWRPLVEWSEHDVAAIHRRHGLRMNPLYAMGASRVGCWPCIHARQSEIVLVADMDQERVAELRDLEHEVTEQARALAMEKGEELDWIRSMFSIRESQKRADVETGEMRRHHRPMQIDEAIAWARAGQARHEPEEDSGSSCGQWGFCESAPGPLFTRAA